MRALVDTNVVIDVLQRREPFFVDSSEVVLACARRHLDGWLAAKSLADIHYLMHRHYHDNEPCLAVIRKLYRLFRVADTTAEACLQASFGAIADYEDAIMDETASAIGARVIVTRNVGDFARSKVAAVEPRALLEML